MKHHFLYLIFFILIATNAHSQVANKIYFIEFTDKKNSEFSINNPSLFLSQQALDRRQRQKIAIDQSDLPVNKTYTNAIKQAGATIIYNLKWLNGSVAQINDTNQLNAILALPFVKSKKTPLSRCQSIEQTTSTAHSQKFGTTIPLKPNPKTIATTDEVELYGRSERQIKILNGEYLHQMGFKGERMHIGVTDAGFSNADQHIALERLMNTGRIIDKKDFVNPQNGNIFGYDSHGTAVLSCMAGYLKGELIGTAPNAFYSLYRTENTESERLIEEYNWIAAAEYADSNGVSIINTSLAYYEFDDPATNHTYKDMNGRTAPISIAQTMAARKGMICITAAGNFGNSSWQYIAAPADADSILSVGAVDTSGKRAAFSSTGLTSDRRIKPNVMSVGAGTIVSYGGGGVGLGNGTSFAAPVLCGLVACLWQAFPSASNMEIIRAIEKSGDRSQTPDSLYGYGIPNFKKAYQILSQKYIDTKGIKNELIVAPNPFQNSLKVAFTLDNNTENTSLYSRITDVLGNKVYEEQIYSRWCGTGSELQQWFWEKNTVMPNPTNNTSVSWGKKNYEYTFDLGKLPSGVYILTITDGQEINMKTKIIKQ